MEHLQSRTSLTVVLPQQYITPQHTYMCILCKVLLTDVVSVENHFRQCHPTIPWHSCAATVENIKLQATVVLPTQCVTSSDGLALPLIREEVPACTTVLPLQESPISNHAGTEPQGNYVLPAEKQTPAGNLDQNYHDDKQMMSADAGCLTKGTEEAASSTSNQQSCSDEVMLPDHEHLPSESKATKAIIQSLVAYFSEAEISPLRSKETPDSMFSGRESSSSVAGLTGSPVTSVSPDARDIHSPQPAHLDQGVLPSFRNGTDVLEDRSTLGDLHDIISSELGTLPMPLSTVTADIHNGSPVGVDRVTQDMHDPQQRYLPLQAVYLEQGLLPPIGYETDFLGEPSTLDGFNPSDLLQMPPVSLSAMAAEICDTVEGQKAYSSLLPLAVEYAEFSASPSHTSSHSETMETTRASSSSLSPPSSESMRAATPAADSLDRPTSTEKQLESPEIVSTSISAGLKIQAFLCKSCHYVTHCQMQARRHFLAKGEEHSIKDCFVADKQQLLAYCQGKNKSDKFDVYICSICDFITARLATYSLHMKVHTEKNILGNELSNEEHQYPAIPSVIYKGKRKNTTASISDMACQTDKKPPRRASRAGILQKVVKSSTTAAGDSENVIANKTNQKRLRLTSQEKDTTADCVKPTLENESNTTPGQITAASLTDEPKELAAPQQRIVVLKEPFLDSFSPSPHPQSMVTTRQAAALVASAPQQPAEMEDADQLDTENLSSGPVLRRLLGYRPHHATSRQRCRR